MENKRKGPLRATTIPVVAEELQVGKKTVETGSTRISIKVKETEEAVEQPLMKEKVEVRRVLINRIIDGPVETRVEGNVTIIPVMEEVLVVEKKLCLKEEVHLIRSTETVKESRNEVLRKEEVVVEHRDTPH